jgi:hypothetical protein
MIRKLLGLERDVNCLADYQRLEYCESWLVPTSIKAHQLKYIDEFNISGIKTKYWTYPTSDRFSYATIE